MTTPDQTSDAPVDPAAVALAAANLPDRTPHGSPLSSHDIARDALNLAKSQAGDGLPEDVSNPEVAAAHGIRELRVDASPGVPAAVQMPGGFNTPEQAAEVLGEQYAEQEAARQAALDAEQQAAAEAELAAANDVNVQMAAEVDAEANESAADEAAEAADIAGQVAVDTSDPTDDDTLDLPADPADSSTSEPTA